MQQKYIPKVNDYVKWKHLEGWVYFYSEDYITIEIGVKDKCPENIRDCPIHMKTHCLVLCYPHQWDELIYVKTREVNEQRVFVGGEVSSEDHRGLYSSK